MGIRMGKARAHGDSYSSVDGNQHDIAIEWGRVVFMLLSPIER